MERSIRIGKDFNVRWSIHRVVDGERQPYELAGKELVLQYRTPYGLKEATEWKTEGNTIVWTFRGKEQKALGSYELVLTENGGKDGMVTVDTCKAFKLVAHSCEETEGSGGDIVVQDIMLESEVSFTALRGPQGEQGPAGPQGPQGERGPEGPQGPAGPSYNDAEIQAKLAELSEENAQLRERLAEQDILIEDLQNTKIDRENDDYYPKMAVGTADNLAGVDEVDSEFTFRQSGGGAITDGVARVQSIKGNSVVYNQYIDNTLSVGKFKSGDSSKAQLSVTTNGFRLTCSVDGTMYAFYRTPEFISSLIVGHKYLRIADINSSVVSGIGLYFRAYGISGDNLFQYASNVKSTCHAIFTVDDITTASPYLQISANQCNIGDYIDFSNIRFIDLTKMFGSGNEPTTIEEFYQRIPMGVDLNAYNEGEVIHMDVQSIESVGVNQWDEEWENGVLNQDGSIGQSARVLTSIFPVIGGKAYFLRTPSSYTIAGRQAFYDKDYNLVRYDGDGAKPNAEFIAPSNASYMRYCFALAYGATYNHDICINISDTSINGQYYPHIKRVEDLSLVRKYFPQGMKSAGSAHDEIRYNKASGKWEKVVRIGEVDMGTLNYTYQPPIEGAYPHGYFRTSPQGKANGNMNILCAKYSTVADWVTVGVRGDDSSNGIYIKDSAYTSAASFKAAMAGVILYYELAEPIVTEIEEKDFNLDYSVWNGGTETAIAEGKSSALAADITYGFNAVGLLKQIKAALQAAGIMV